MEFLGRQLDAVLRAKEEKEEAQRQPRVARIQLRRASPRRSEPVEEGMEAEFLAANGGLGRSTFYALPSSPTGAGWVDLGGGSGPEASTSAEEASTSGQGASKKPSSRRTAQPYPHSARQPSEPRKSEPGASHPSLGRQASAGPSTASSSRNSSSLPRESGGVPSASSYRKLLRKMGLGSEEELESSGEANEEGRSDMKLKLKSYLAQVRYGMPWQRRAANFDSDSPIWLLGKFYHSRALVTESPQGDRDAELITQVESVLEDFQEDFVSKLWFTYRAGFPALDGTDLRSDAGWGCMLRSGQMILGQALILHELGREWSLYESHSRHSVFTHQRIVGLFGDSPACPLSLHSLVAVGQRTQGKAPGDWYGPSSVALVLRDVFDSAIVAADPLLSQLTVHVARDCAVYEDEVEAACTAAPSTAAQAANGAERPAWEAPGPFDSFVKVERASLVGSSGDSLRRSPMEALPSSGEQRTERPEAPWAKSLVLFVPLRLGTQHLNPAYAQHLRTLLSLRNCLGLIGGKPKHSMYFLGVHGDSLIYLDPHFTQDFEDTQQQGFKMASFHCHTPRKLELSEIDPSCAVGFYARTRQEWRQLLADLAQIVETEGEERPVKGAPRQALFSVLKTRRPAREADAHSPAAHRTANSHGFELL